MSGTADLGESLAKACFPPLKSKCSRFGIDHKGLDADHHMPYVHDLNSFPVAIIWDMEFGGDGAYSGGNTAVVADNSLDRLFKVEAENVA